MRENRAEYWAEVIREQTASGQSVRQFCEASGVGEHSFYLWRKRLRAANRKPKKIAAVRFALVDGAGGIDAIGETRTPGLELRLPGGEQLRIERGVDAETLRLVLQELRR